jgi:hypothetical protein
MTAVNGALAGLQGWLLHVTHLDALAWLGALTLTVALLALDRLGRKR